MKRISDEKKALRSKNMVRKEVYDEIQKNKFIKDKLQSSIEQNVQERRKKEKSYWLHADGLKLLLTMNPMVKH